MRICLQCSTPLGDDARFCGQCGESSDTRPCPACNAINVLDNQFCDQCGMGFAFVTTDTSLAPLRTTVSMASAERKLATVVFADVVGYTTLAEHADPEVVANTIDSALRRMSDVVRRYGGTVDKYLGDGLMAVFGVPNAHDDDAERAIVAALELVGLFDFAAELTLSIGVNSGEVMAMAVGEDSRVTVIGDVVNVAARLEKVAGPGQVLAGPLTAELAGGRVLFRRREPVLVKGKSDEVDVWEAIALRTATVVVADHTFVGRADELERLLQQYRGSTSSSSGSYVAISGPGGIGKSRLGAELCARLSDRDDYEIPRVVSLSYPPYGAATSASVYAQLFDTLGATGDLAIDTRVRLLAGDVDASMRLLDLRSLEREGYWGLRQFLRFHARNQPLLLIVDDLHRADRSIRTLLFDIVDQLDDAPVVAVCIGRDSQAVWLDGLDQRHIMTLEPLSAEEALLYIKNDEVASSLRSDVVEAIVERASGNPLYLRELLRYEMSFDTQDPLGANSEDRLLPASLKSVLGARLDAMEKSDKVCVQHVSILGDYATADRIAALGPLSFDVSLRRLVESGVLQQDANGAYSVVDGLLAEVAYETLPHNVRGLRHRTAALLATTQLERAQQFDLAMQYLAEDSLLRADNAQAHAVAGIEAFDRANLIEGVSLLWRAVELGYRQPAELCRLAHVLIDLGRVGEARRVLQSVVFEANDPRTSDLMLRRDYLYALTYPESESVTASVDLQRVAQGYADKQDESAYGEALLSLAQLLARMGDDDQAVVVADRAYEALLTSDDIRRVLIARRIRSQLRPDQSEVLNDLLRDLEAVEKLNDRSLLVDWLSAIAQDEFVATYDAYPENTQQLESTLLRLIDITRDLGMSDLEVVGCSLLGALCRFQGRASEAIQYTERAWQLEVSDNEELVHLRHCADFVVGLVSDPLRDDVPYATSRRDPLSVASNLMTQAGLLLHGRSEEARQHVQASLEGHTGVGRSWIRYRLNYARSLADSHRYADAKAIADECFNLSSRQRSHSLRACALSLAIELTGALDSSAILPDKLGPVRGIACLEELAVIRARRFYAPNLDDRQVLDQAAEDALASLGADLILLSGR